jgi:Plasmid replication region DNA-binding N-term
VSQGRKVSGRAVQKEIGGSLNTIYPHIDSWRARDSKNTVVAEIPADVQKTILLALDQCAKKATEALSIKMDESSERGNEVLD